MDSSVSGCKIRNMRIIALLSAAAALSTAVAAEKKVKMEDLPAAVRQSAQEQLKAPNTVLGGISAETEKGKTFYELETKVSGRSRDLLLDSAGKVVEIEEEVDLAKIPAPARAAIQKKAGKASITMVESLTKSAGVEAFEAHIKKGARDVEYAVTPEGKPYKD